MNYSNVAIFSPQETPLPPLDNAFIFTIDTGVSSTYDLPFNPAINYVVDYTISWGDGSSDVITSTIDAARNHTYSSPGEYQVAIIPNTEVPVTYIRTSASSDEAKIKSIDQWGNLLISQDDELGTMANIVEITSTPPLPTFNTTTLRRFYRSSYPSQGVLDVTGFCSSQVTTINTMLFLQNPNTPIIGLETWDVSNVTDMSFSFSGINMTGVDLSGWNTANAVNFRNMFSNIQQNVEFSMAGWNVEKVTDMRTFIAIGSGFANTADYDATLISWANQNVKPNIIVQFGNNSKYTLGSAAEIARNTLITTYGWTITDGGGV